MSAKTKPIQVVSTFAIRLPDIDQRAGNWPAKLGRHRAGELQHLAAHVRIDKIGALRGIRFKVGASRLARRGVVTLVACGGRRHWLAKGAVERRDGSTKVRRDERARHEELTPGLHRVAASADSSH